MSGIGFSELIILALIGLIVLGPERLPRVANQLGGWLGQARRMTRVMKRQLEDELDLEKDLGLKPPPTLREPSTQRFESAPREDDGFSPAHDADDVGTGVGDTRDDDEAEVEVEVNSANVAGPAEDEATAEENSLPDTAAASKTEKAS